MILRSKIDRYCSAVLSLVFTLAMGCSEKPTASHHSEPTPNEPPVKSPPKTVGAVPTAATDLLGVKPDFVMKPKELTDAFDKDPTAFLKKYGGTIIDISGTVLTVEYSRRGDIGSLLLGPDFKKFECKAGQPMDRAIDDQIVTMRGRCDPVRGMVDWLIVDAKGDSPQSISAQQLAKELKVDEEGTTKKLRGKTIVVTGTIAEVVKESTSTTIYLTPKGNKPEVTCGFSGAAEEVAEKKGWFKVGQSVRILGRSGSGNPFISSCSVLPPAK